MKNKLIQVKLALLFTVNVPEDGDTLSTVGIIRKQLDLLGYSKNNLQLTVDDCEEMPNLIDEII